jgi:hypothetical protein
MTYHVKYLAPYRLDTSTFTIPEEVSVRPQDGVDPQVVSELVIDADGGLP